VRFVVRYRRDRHGVVAAAALIAPAERVEGRPPAEAVVGVVGLAVWGRVFMPVSEFLAILATAAVAACRRTLPPFGPNHRRV